MSGLAIRLMREVAAETERLTARVAELEGALGLIITAHDSYLKHNSNASVEPDWLDDEINAARKLFEVQS